MNTRDFRSLPAEAQEDIRRRAVSAVRQGRTRGEVAELFGVTRQAVWGWMRLYKEGGAKALAAQPRGRHKGGTLKPWQAAQVVRLVRDHCPDQLKLPFYLWTREAVGELIQRKFGLDRSVWTVGRYLSDWGLTPQKPTRRAFEQNPEAVRRWLRETYPSIRAKAKREGAVILWGDEMGMRSDHATGRSYGVRGQTPVIPGTGQRFGCNMISAITNRGHLYFMVFKKRFVAAVCLEFLKRLIRQVPQKVYLILDGHPVHRARRVVRWIEENRYQLRVFFLPGYSPELNPDELLNQDVKSNAVGRMRPGSQHEMITTVRSYLRRTQAHPEIVANYFQEEHVRYAAM
jgi:transposase